MLCCDVTGEHEGPADDRKLAQVEQWSVERPAQPAAQPATWPSSVDLALSSSSVGSPKQKRLAPGQQQAGFLPVEAQSAAAAVCLCVCVCVVAAR